MEALFCAIFPPKSCPKQPNISSFFAQIPLCSSGGFVVQFSVPLFTPFLRVEGFAVGFQ